MCDQMSEKSKYLFEFRFNSVFNTAKCQFISKKSYFCSLLKYINFNPHEKNTILIGYCAAFWFL